MIILSALQLMGLRCASQVWFQYGSSAHVYSVWLAYNWLPIASISCFMLETLKSSVFWVNCCLPLLHPWLQYHVCVYFSRAVIKLLSHVGCAATKLLFSPACQPSCPALHFASGDQESIEVNFSFSMWQHGNVSFLWPLFLIRMIRVSIYRLSQEWKA